MVFLVRPLYSVRNPKVYTFLTNPVRLTVWSRWGCMYSTEISKSLFCNISQGLFMWEKNRSKTCGFPEHWMSKTGKDFPWSYRDNKLMSRRKYANFPCRLMGKIWQIQKHECVLSFIHPHSHTSVCNSNVKPNLDPGIVILMGLVLPISSLHSPYSTTFPPSTGFAF